MSDKGTLITQAQTTLPTITGNPKLDAMLRNALIAVSASLATAIVAWLNAHGIMTWLDAYGVVAWLSQMGMSPLALIFGAIFSFLLLVAGFVWSLIQQNLARASIATQVMHAAKTAQVSPAVIKDATVEQAQEFSNVAAKQSPETEQAITAKLNNAEASRSRQMGVN